MSNIEMPSHEDIERKLREIYGQVPADESEDMLPALLGVLVDRCGGNVVITQAQLDAPSESVTITLGDIPQGE